MLLKYCSLVSLPSSDYSSLILASCRWKIEAFFLKSNLSLLGGSLEYSLTGLSSVKSSKSLLLITCLAISALLITLDITSLAQISLIGTASTAEAKLLESFPNTSAVWELRISEY